MVQHLMQMIFLQLFIRYRWQQLIQLNLKIQPLETGREITLAVLSELGFEESFVETEVGLEAYIQEKDCEADLLDHLYPLAEKGLDISWSLTAIPPENWNAVWESDFQPIIIENQLL